MHLPKVTSAGLLELPISIIKKFTHIMYCVKIDNKLVAKDFKSYPEALAWKKHHCSKGRVVKQ